MVLAKHLLVGSLACNVLALPTLEDVTGDRLVAIDSKTSHAAFSVDGTHGTVPMKTISGASIGPNSETRGVRRFHPPMTKTSPQSQGWLRQQNLSKRENPCHKIRPKLVKVDHSQELSRQELANEEIGKLIEEAYPPKHEPTLQELYHSQTFGGSKLTHEQIRQLLGSPSEEEVEESKIQAFSPKKRRIPAHRIIEDIDCTKPTNLTTVMNLCALRHGEHHKSAEVVAAVSELEHELQAGQQAENETGKQQEEQDDQEQGEEDNFKQAEDVDQVLKDLEDLEEHQNTPKTVSEQPMPHSKPDTQLQTTPVRPANDSEEAKKEYFALIDHYRHEQCFEGRNLAACKCDHPFKFGAIWDQMRGGKRKYGMKDEPNVYTRFAKVMLATCKRFGTDKEKVKPNCEWDYFVDCALSKEPQVGHKGPLYDIAGRPLGPMNKWEGEEEIV